ncbi:MAG: hypothetical protein J1D87_02890 [Lachnospiraceae bacterium]|nr:hypothetical protein [Lachnospiraceae bacterium]
MKKVLRKMKQALSGVLIVAMLVTMLPQSLGGAITVSAAETSDIDADTEFVIEDNVEQESLGESEDGQESSYDTYDEQENIDETDVIEMSTVLGSEEELDGERVLVIGSEDLGGADALTPENIVAKMQEYESQGRHFQVISLNLEYKEGAVISGAVVNKAIGLLEPAYEQRRIEYCFSNDAETYKWTLFQPSEFGEEELSVYGLDVKRNNTNNQYTKQGISIQLNGIDMRKLPVANISLYVEKSELLTNGMIPDIIFGGRNLNLKVFTLQSNRIDTIKEECSAYCGDKGITIDNVGSLTPNSKNLMLCCEGDTDNEDVEPIVIQPNSTIKLMSFPDSVVDDDRYVYDFNSTLIDAEKSGNVTTHAGTGECYAYFAYLNTNRSNYIHTVYKIIVGAPSVEYEGRVEDRDGKRVLVISCDEGGADALTPDNIVAIMQKYKDNDQYFNLISLRLKYEADAVISSDVVNKAIELLNPSDNQSGIEYSFYDGATTYKWTLVKPSEFDEGDFGVYGAATVNRGNSSNDYKKQGISIQLSGNTDMSKLHATNIGLYVENSNWLSNGVISDVIFGGRNLNLKVFTMQRNHIDAIKEGCSAYCDEKGITINNVNSLVPGVKHLIICCEGDTDNAGVRPKVIPPNSKVQLMVFPEDIYNDEEARQCITFGSTLIEDADRDGYVTTKADTGEAYVCFAYAISANDSGTYNYIHTVYRIKIDEPSNYYKGVIEKETVNGIQINKLVFDWRDTDSGELEAQQVIEILKEYQEKGQKFNKIVFDFTPNDKHEIDREVINAAVDIMVENAEAAGFTYTGNVEYRFSNSEDSDYTSLILYNPQTTEGVNFDFTDAVTAQKASNADYQGIKLKVNHSLEGLPAQWSEIYLERNAWKDDTGKISDKLFGGNGGYLTIFLLKNGEIIGTVGWYRTAYYGDYGVSINAAYIAEDSEYLLMYCEGDADNEGVEPISLMPGETLQLPDAPDGAVWKSLTEYVATVDDTGMVTAVVGGDTYVIAKYQTGGEDCFKAYKIVVGSSEDDYLGGIDVDPETGEKTLFIYGYGLTKERIVQILETYKDVMIFDNITLELVDEYERKNIPKEIDKDIVNTVVDMLDPASNSCRFEYRFHDYGRGSCMWTLYHPKKITRSISGDVDASCMSEDNHMRFTLYSGFQAVADKVDLSIEGWSVYGWGVSSVFGGKNKQLDIFKISDDEEAGISSWVNGSYGWYEQENMNIYNVGALSSGTPYLIFCCEDLDTIDVGTSRTLQELGLNSGVEYKVLKGTGEVSLSSAVLSAGGPGYAYIYPYYGSKVNSVYKIHILPKTAQSIKLVPPEEAIELGENYEPAKTTLQVEFDSAQTKWELDDPEKIKWEVSDSSIVEMVNIGRDSQNPIYDGTIRALKAGETQITITYIKDTTKPAEGSNVLKDTCTVKVVDPVKITDEDWPEVFAVTNFDLKLSDVSIPLTSWVHRDGTKEEGTWSWVEPNTSLKQFKGQEEAVFKAIYKVNDGRENEYNITLNMYTLTGISFLAFDESGNSADAPLAVANGDTVELGYRFETDRGSWDDIVEYYKNRHGEDILKTYFDRIKTEWSSKPAVTGTLVNDGYASGKISYRYTGRLSGSKAEKKTFTVSIKDADNTNAVVLKGTYSITVTNHPTVDFSKVSYKYDESKLHFFIEEERYKNLTGKKLTFKSNDTAMMTLNVKQVSATEFEDEEGKWMDVSIPYTLKKRGVVYVTVTAMDEVKSSKVFRFEFPDREPKLDSSTVILNKKLTDVSVEVLVLTRKDTELGTAGVVLSGNDSGLFDIEHRQQEPTADRAYILHHYLLSPKNVTNLSKKKYVVTVELPVSWNENSGENLSESHQETYKAALTIKVEDKAPSLTFKQTQKVNTFYAMDNEKGYGLLTVNTGGYEIDTLTLSDCDFEIKPLADDSSRYEIIRTRETISDKKGVLSCKLKGYSTAIEKNITIGVSKTKPTIKLSSTSDTFYLRADVTESKVSLTDKATGKALAIQKVVILNSKDASGKPLSIDSGNTGSAKPGKNDFGVHLDGDKGILSFELGGDAGGGEDYEDYELNEHNKRGEDDEDDDGDGGDEGGYKKETARFKIQIHVDGWENPVEVSYKISVTNAIPKFKLSTSTLTLNKNDAVWTNQKLTTNLSMKGCSSVIKNDISVKPKSNNNNGLLVNYNSKNGTLTAEFDKEFNHNNIKTGTYQYKVSMTFDLEGDWDDDKDHTKVVSATLKVKVVDTAPEKGIKLTAKGSIDALDRDGTSIVYTPKLNNLAGEITDGRLKGTDQSLFDSVFKDGKLEVRLKDGAAVTTKSSYKVKAEFDITNEDNASYQAASKEFTIKVKQGKPKLTLSAGGNTIYRQFNNEIEIDFNALLKQKNVAISNVSLLNYKDDLILYDYNPDTQSIRLSTQNTGKEILKSGKTWKVKFAVRYRDKAGNMKDVNVTYKVLVK